MDAHYRKSSSYRSKSQMLPICVDLDGTLVLTDTLAENVAAVILDLRVMALIPFWLLKSKAYFKAKIAENRVPNPELLPYNKSVLRYLKKEKELGRSLFLVTAANKRIAEAINNHLNLFDDIITSDHSQNLRGRKKAEVLLEKFGKHNFIYIGNDKTDLHVWKVAHSGILVTTSKRVTNEAGKIVNIIHHFPGNTSNKFVLLKAIRAHQWVKNLLIYVPILTSGNFVDLVAWSSAVTAFFAFCFGASFTYLINDILDLESDRKHPQKRNRPIASGELSIKSILIASPFLLALGLFLAFLSKVLILFVSYIIISLIYSMKLKRLALIDLFVLSGLYTIRLFSGGEATGYFVSQWLLAFSGFLFFGLANVKRVAELKLIKPLNRNKSFGRSYITEDLPILQTMGIASSFASCLVLALYVQSNVAMNLYHNPKLLWFLVPFMLFWQCRMWFSTSRGLMHSDPILYAAKDWVSWILGISIIVVLFLANSRFLN